jgi:hypothetical protein
MIFNLAYLLFKTFSENKKKISFLPDFRLKSVDKLFFSQVIHRLSIFV